MLYLDTSALAKLLTVEPESDVLRTHLGSQPLATSAISRTELGRVALRLGAAAAPVAESVLSACFVLHLDTGLLRVAGRLQPASLRSLDALHLASALALQEEIRAFVAYDVRLLAAAEQHGLAVESPGASIPGNW